MMFKVGDIIIHNKSHPQSNYLYDIIVKIINKHYTITSLWVHSTPRLGVYPIAFIESNHSLYTNSMAESPYLAPQCPTMNDTEEGGA